MQRTWQSTPSETAAEVPRARWARRRPLLRSEQQRPQIHPDPELHTKLAQMQSFSELLQPRLDLGSHLIGLRDLNSTGALFEIAPLPSEARPLQRLQSMHHKALQAMTSIFPERERDPWLAQFFVYDDRSTFDLAAYLADYAAIHGKRPKYTKSWLAEMHQHFADMSQGIFREDESAWQLRQRRLRLCVWRRVAPAEKIEPSDQMDAVLERLVAALQQAELRVKRLNATALFHWLCEWFAPADPDQQLAVDPRPPWTPQLASADLSRSALQSVAPESSADGCWWFNGCPTRFLTIDEPSRVPDVGHLTADRQIGDRNQALWDRMPDGSIWSMTVAFVSQDQVTDHIQRVRHHSIGADPTAIARRQNADEALASQAAGQPVWRVFAGVFVRAGASEQLEQRIGRTIAVLNGQGLRTIAPQHDPIAHDSFIRALPFGFDLEQDRRWYARRARLWHADHATRLMPFLGRSIGTQHPGIIQFNRGAEILSYDPLHEQDRRKNAHSLILGPTGSGKTSLLIYQLLNLLATRSPRLFLVTALPTFGLFADWCERCGLSVVRRSIGYDDVRLPPFSAAAALTEDQSDIEDASQYEDLAFANLQATEPRGRGDEIKERHHHGDPLGEMEILARLMITGGNPADEQELRRHDLDMIRSAIVYAAEHTAPQQQTLTSDVVAALNQAASGRLGDISIPESRRQTAAEMAAAIHLYCTGANAEIFDRPGDAWPEADVTVIELGYFARSGYEDRLALAVTSLMRSIQDLVEAQQYTERQTIVVVDEAHVLLQNPLVSPYLARIVATWRTYGAWLWIATQNLRQFPEAAKELLDQPEWWTVLSVDADEIGQIAKFRALSDDQQAMILSAKKRPGYYTEGAVLSGTLLNLFRSVPPALALALAQTEKHEKAERQKIMQEMGVSEIDAAIEIARRIRKDRKQTWSQ